MFASVFVVMDTEPTHSFFGVSEIHFDAQIRRAQKTGVAEEGRKTYPKHEKEIS
jgi:hypothetical protein